MGEYGDADIVRNDRGAVQVARADPVIGVAVDLLAECEPWMYGPDGLLWLDPVGDYRYRPLKFATDQKRVLICERVT